MGWLEHPASSPPARRATYCATSRRPADTRTARGRWRGVPQHRRVAGKGRHHGEPRLPTRVSLPPLVGATDYPRQAVPPTGLEPAASDFVGRRSLQMSYGGMVGDHGVEPRHTDLSDRPRHRLSRRPWAESEGIEPPRGFHRHRLSKPSRYHSGNPPTRLVRDSNPCISSLTGRRPLRWTDEACVPGTRFERALCWF